MNRREFTIGAGFTAAAALSGSQTMAADAEMHGVIDKIITHDGKRDEFISIILEGTSGMPGLLSYIVSKDLKDDNALWVTEVWESLQKHQDSFRLDAVQAMMAKGKPLIADFGERVETRPVGGQGLLSS